MPYIKDTSPPKICAAKGCRRQIAGQYLMCVSHWRLVPEDGQHQVYRTWRGYCNARDRNSSIMALRRYRSAVEAAIAAVAAKPFSDLQGAIDFGKAGADADTNSPSTTNERAV